MHKYDIVNSDWSQNINILYSKVELYINRLMNINHKCTGSVIRELCETRDGCNTHFLSPIELLHLIEMLCLLNVRNKYYIFMCTLNILQPEVDVNRYTQEQRIWTQ